jgi:hypothetical protein
VVAFSQGIAYFHAGQEMLRSKSMDRNSYDSRRLVQPHRLQLPRQRLCRRAAPARRQRGQLGR